MSETSLRSESLLLRALRGERTERPPIWLMRQAGRSDPAYRALRASVNLPLENLFRHPELAARISLLPRSWGVDGLIFFQDILTPLEPMGARFVFCPGPHLETPLQKWDSLDTLRLFDPAEEMPYVEETLRLVRREAGNQMPILGFAGAPFTLLAFLAENGSPPASLPHTRALLREHPDTARRLLETLARMTAGYLGYQIASGVDAVQLFESAALYLSRAEYQEYCLPAQRYVFDALRGKAPTIAFSRMEDRHVPLEDLVEAGADVISLPSCYSISQARKTLGESLVVQGNLSKTLLASGPTSAIETAALECIRQGDCRGHVFNLDHGLLPETPHGHVTFLVDLVRSYAR